MGPRDGGPVGRFVAEVEEFLTPLSTAGAVTILNHWRRYVKAARLSRAHRARPHTAAQVGFLGYLRKLGTVGGATARDYLLGLPRALALAQGLWEPAFLVAPAAKRVAGRMAWELPATRTLRRDPLTVETLRQVAADSGTRSDVRAALVVQFWLGARGINVYSTTHSRSTRRGDQRRLQWGDIVWQGEKSVFVTLRQEKNATQHTGTFPPVPLVRSPDPAMTPCPISALIRMRDEAREAGRLTAQAPVFPSVTDADVNAALARHAPPGTRLTTHSARAGAATTQWEAGASDRAVRVTGRWRTDGAADRYARVSTAMAAAAMRAVHRKASQEDMMGLNKIEEVVAQVLERLDKIRGREDDRDGDRPQDDRDSEPPSQGELTMASGQLRINHMDGKNTTIYLMARAADRKGAHTWRAYLYSTSHARTLRPRLGHNVLMEYDTFQGPDAIKYFMKHTSPYPVTVTEGSELDKDQQELRRQMETPLRPPKTVRLADRDQAHKAARAMGSDHPRFEELYKHDLNVREPDGELGEKETEIHTQETSGAAV